MLEYRNGNKAKVRDLLKEEIAIMKALKSSWIVQMYEALEDEQSRKIYIVMELCSRGAILSEDFWNSRAGPGGLPTVLDEVVLRPRQLTIPEVRRYFIQIAKGVQYCKFI